MGSAVASSCTSSSSPGRQDASPAGTSWRCPRSSPPRASTRRGPRARDRSPAQEGARPPPLLQRRRLRRRICSSGPAAQDGAGPPRLRLLSGRRPPPLLHLPGRRRPRLSRCRGRHPLRRGLHPLLSRPSRGQHRLRLISGSHLPGRGPPRGCSFWRWATPRRGRARTSHATMFTGLWSFSGPASVWPSIAVTCSCLTAGRGRGTGQL